MPLRGTVITKNGYKTRNRHYQMNIESVVARLAQQVERRYYGKYRGFVVDREDPEQLGRLRVTVPSVLGEEVVTGWAMPCVPYGGEANQGFLFIPEAGAGVWIEFEEGDLEFPIWTGTFWSKPGGSTEAPTTTDENGADTGGIADPPTRKIIRTVSGHTIQFEDDDGEEVRIVISDGQEENVIVFSKTGLKLVNKANSITMTDDGIVIEETSGNKITQDSSGTVIEDLNGNTITESGGGIELSDVFGNTIKMDATSGGIPGTPGISLNGNRKVCLDGLITWLMSHTHVGNMGAPTPVNPAQLIELSTALAAPAGNILAAKITAG